MKVNGRPVAPPEDPALRLLDFLRNELGLTGAKEGCGMGECGACTVLLNGRPVCSCLVLLGQVGEADVVTVEGIAGAGFARLLEAFVTAHASQCGYCTPGMVVSAAGLLNQVAQPDEEMIRRALAGNLCRCTGYGPLVKAIQEVGRETSAGDAR